MKETFENSLHFVKLIFKNPVVLLLLFSLFLAPACKRNTCPANSGGFIDKPKKVKRNAKPKSGLFPKNMRR
jgi:hypothetical protein